VLFRVEDNRFGIPAEFYFTVPIAQAVREQPRETSPIRG